MSEENAQDKKVVKKHRRFIRTNGKLVSKVFSRKTDADRWYYERRREKELIETGLASPLETQTVGEFSEQWLSSRKANGKPLSSWECDEARLRLYIVPAYGSVPMQRISTREWERFLDGLVVKDEISPATRNRIRAILCKMYNDARRQEVVGSNPISIIPRLKEASEQWDYWQTKEEVAAYLGEASKVGPSFFIFAMFALNSGVRVGEILSLEWGDIQLENRRFNIWRIFEEASHTVCKRTKGLKARWLEINKDLYEALVEYRRLNPNQKRNSPLVFNLEGAHMNQDKIRATHRKVCRLAGVKEMRVHDLRHTFSSHYVMNGGSLAELQGILGHSVPAMTQKYAHLAPGFLESKSGVVSFSWKVKEEADVISIASVRK